MPTRRYRSAQPPNPLHGEPACAHSLPAYRRSTGAPKTQALIGCAERAMPAARPEKRGPSTYCPRQRKNHPSATAIQPTVPPRIACVYWGLHTPDWLPTTDAKPHNFFCTANIGTTGVACRAANASGGYSRQTNPCSCLKSTEINQNLG